MQNDFPLQGLFALSDAYSRMRYKVKKQEGHLKDMREMLHAYFHHGSKVAECLLRLECELKDFQP